MAQQNVKEIPSKKSQETSTAPGPKTSLVKRMYETRIALSPEVKEQTVEVMQERLAEALDMYSQAKFAHWNVKATTSTSFTWYLTRWPRRSSRRSTRSRSA